MCTTFCMLCLNERSCTVARSGISFQVDHRQGLSLQICLDAKLSVNSTWLLILIICALWWFWTLRLKFNDYNYNTWYPIGNEINGELMNEQMTFRPIVNETTFQCSAETTCNQDATKLDRGAKSSTKLGIKGLTVAITSSVPTNMSIREQTNYSF